MFCPGSVVKDVKIIKELKQGAQGFVYLGEYVGTHEQIVLKSVYIENSKKPQHEKVIKAWKSLSESKVKEFFVEYKSHFDEGKNIMIVMEFCTGGDLETVIKKKQTQNSKFNESDVLKVLYEGMSALNEMQIMGFIHCDIKSANIFFGKDGKTKIGDFNASKVMEGSVGGTTITGTLEFTAPEVINSEGYSCAADTFSFGAVLYQMMVGRTPFVNARGLVMKDLLAGKFEPVPDALGYSEELVEVVHACLRLNPFPPPKTCTDSYPSSHYQKAGGRGSQGVANADCHGTGGGSRKANECGDRNAAKKKRRAGGGQRKK